MPLFILRIKCDLENIAELSFTDETLWKFNVESESGEVREGITFSKSDDIELSGSKGTANFVMKWPGDHHQAHIKIVHIKKVDGKYKSEDSGKFVTLLGLDCRGLIPSVWIPGMDFNATTSAGKVFNNIDLTERDWAEYDEENDESLSVTNLEYSIERG